MPAVEKRERQKQERRESIVSAAVRVFLARGVEAATMDEIAREAGVSKGALYLYFSSKDELFLTIAIEWLDQMQGKLEELQRVEHQRGIDLVRAGAKMYARHALDCPARFRVAMSWLSSAYSVDEASPLFKKYQAAVAQKYQFMLNAFQRAKDDQSVTCPEPPFRIGLQLWGALLGLILVEQNSVEMARRLPVSPPTAGICEAFVDNFLAGVGAESPRRTHLSSVPSLESDS